MNVNQNGDYYAAGVPYDMSKKMEVLQAYLNLMRELDPAGTLVNKDVYNTRVRANPMTGCVWCIFVFGNFREAYTLIGIIRTSGWNIMELLMKILLNYLLYHLHRLEAIAGFPRP
jgi:hypothetical protein